MFLKQRSWSLAAVVGFLLHHSDISFSKSSMGMMWLLWIRGSAWDSSFSTLYPTKSGNLVLLPIMKISQLFFFFWWHQEFELRALCLLVRHSTTWATFSALITVDIFQVWSHVLCQALAWNHDHPTYASSRAGTTGMSYHTHLTYWEEVSLSFCPCGLEPQSSWVTKITGVCHHTQPQELIF
jgi:hypothetical protein